MSLRVRIGMICLCLTRMSLGGMRIMIELVMMKDGEEVSEE